MIRDDGCILTQVLELLRLIRAEVHGKVESSVIRQIDEAIQNLEIAKRDQKRGMTRTEVLKIVEKVIEVLPTIARFIEMLN